MRFHRPRVHFRFAAEQEDVVPPQDGRGCKRGHPPGAEHFAISAHAGGGAANPREGYGSHHADGVGAIV